MMKRTFQQYSLIAGVIITLSCNVSLCAHTGASDPSFTVRSSGDVMAIFKNNASGNITEYYLVQGATTAIDPNSIKEVGYTESQYIQVRMNDGFLHRFALKSEYVQQTSYIQSAKVYGIAHLTVLKKEGITLAEAEQMAFSNEPGGTGSASGCGGSCLSGGCGATQCSRNLGGLTQCEVTCDSGYFACCGDLITYGCKCLNNSCCGKN